MIRAARFAALAAFLLTPAAAWAQASPSPYTSATRYDAVGRVTGTISADPDGVGTGNPFLAVRNTYDAAGRLTKVETGMLSSWQSEAVVPGSWGAAFTPLSSIETQYDVMGRKVRDILREGSAGTIRTATDYSYDAAGRPDCTAIRMNAANFAAPLAACTQGTGGADRITRNFYDVADQRIQLREGIGSIDEGTEATWAYNLNGQIVTVIDGNGNRAQLVYDGHGRQNCWMFPSTTRAAAFNDTTQATALATSGALSGTITSGHCATGDFEAYTVDPNGNRTRLRKRDTRRIDFAYDNLNRVTQKTYPDGGATGVYYGYDLRNLQLFARFTSAGGEGITSAYDGFGRLSSNSTDMGGTTRTLTYQYDRNGNRTRITHPDGDWFQQDYDGLNRPTMLARLGVPGQALLVYDSAGLAYAMGLGNGYTRFFTYDGVQRLAGLTNDLASTGADVTWSFPRNPASQIASSTRDNDAYAWGGHYAVQRPYTTNGLNQYSAAGGATFGYDGNGNLTSDGTRTYTYDVENRLVSVSNGAALSYDPLGRLYEVSLGGNTTRFLYDGDALIAEYVAGTLTRRYVHGVGADVPIVRYDNNDPNQIRFLYADNQGSIVATSDPSGYSIGINTYDEYGIPGTANTGRFQYTGQIWLPEIGMYHYKARVYSPTLGRFLQTDPIGYDDQFNLYAYVGNDPVNDTDPSGLMRCGDDTPRCRTFNGGDDAGGSSGGDPESNGRGTPRIGSGGRPPQQPEGGNFVERVISGALRRVGGPLLNLFESEALADGTIPLSVDTVMSNPDMLRDTTLGEAISTMQRLPDNWVLTGSFQGRHQAEGYALREVTSKGNRDYFTGRVIRWHPGGTTHPEFGGRPYWIISRGGNTQEIRFVAGD